MVMPITSTVIIIIIIINSSSSSIIIIVIVIIYILIAYCLHCTYYHRHVHQDLQKIYTF